MAVPVTREHVLAYRQAAQGLTSRQASDPLALAVLELGAQDTPAGAARLAVSARLASPLPAAAAAALGDGSKDGLTLIWSHRGGPHLHRTTELPDLAAALWPRGDADAAARLGAPGRTLTSAGFSPLEAIRVTAQAVAEVVSGAGSDGGLPKGELSGQVTRRIPAELSIWCRGCGSTHVFDSLLRLAALPGGARMVPGSAPLRFVPVAGWPGVPQARGGAAGPARAYLRLLGPAGPSEVAGFLGTSRRELGEAWPGEGDGLAEVNVDGRTAWIDERDLPALLAARRPSGVRLIGPADPYLQARDRYLPLPEKAHQKEVYKILGNPGAVLVDGEIAATWRPKTSGRRLEVTVSPLRPLPASAGPAIEREAARLATTRGAEDATVKIV